MNLPLKVKSLAYYPGCALHGSAQEYDLSTRQVFEALGIELSELDGWLCCGAYSANFHPQEELALSAYNLKLSRGKPILAPCAMCFHRLKSALYQLREERLPSVYHPMQLFAQERLVVSRPLKGLKVVCYYGCLLSRPPQILEFGGENPTIMERVVASLGAEVLSWGFKTECCGSGLPLVLPEMVFYLSMKILSGAKEAGAEAIVTGCPMCQSNLDLYQKEISKRFGEGFQLPVLYITQLVGLALGIHPKELGLDKHFTSPMALVEKVW